MPRTDPQDGFLTPARSLSGRYELLGRLGSGGMAEVYLARAVGIEEFEKIVVLKRVLPSRSDDRRYLAMFRDEARVAATLEHPNIVHTHDIGMQDAECFFTMEYLHGEDLKAILSAATEAGEQLPLELALQIAIGCAAGLHHAHEQTDYAGHPLGIVHRDVSPSNVIVTRQSGVKLIDFGIAKAASDKEQTGVGVIKGKAAYMSPEQCRGEPLDRRSDIFALGIVLFEMITMTRPFVAENVLGTVHKILQHQPPPCSELRPDCPAALSRIVAKAMRKEASDRYETVFAMQEELELATRDCGLLALPGALGRYLEHLFGPKPHPWTQHARKPAPEPRYAWAELDSTLTGTRPNAATPPRVVVAGAAPSPVVTAPVHGATAPGTPSPAPIMSAHTEAQGSDTSIDYGTTPPTASHVPVSASGRTIRHLVLGGLMGGVLVGAGLSMWMNTRPEPTAPAQPAAVAKAETPAAGSPAAIRPPPSPPLPSGETSPTTLEPLPTQPEVLESSSPTEAEAEAEADTPPLDARADSEPDDADDTQKRTSRRGSAAEANALIERARKKMFASPSEAHRDAKRAYDMRQSQTALLLMGFAACRMRDQSKARFAHRRLRGKGKTEMESACLQKGIDLR